MDVVFMPFLKKGMPNKPGPFDFLKRAGQRVRLLG